MTLDIYLVIYLLINMICLIFSYKSKVVTKSLNIPINRLFSKTGLESPKPMKLTKSEEEEVEEEYVNAKYNYILNNINENDIKVKTGSQLRKENRENLRIERVKQSQKYSNNEKSLNSDKLDKKKRFKLGNGFDVLTAESLLGLVKLTAPYYFPDEAIRAVIDEDEIDNSYKEKDNNSNVIIDGTNIRLSELSKGTDGWKKILLSPTLSPSDNPTIEQRIDYFSLCLAAHFSTVATFVPTDVDSKIRGHCWFDPDEEVLIEQFNVLKNALNWEVESVSKRVVWVREIDEKQPISGHNGEWLGCLIGAWGAFLRIGRNDLAEEAESIILNELQREAKAFKYMCDSESNIENDTKLLKLSAILTHNVGDVDQGYSYWTVDKKSKITKLEMKSYISKYTKLAHERFDRFGGEFGRAKAIYKELLSAEGHRNYPLREAKVLRNSLDFALPLGPWLESWGYNIVKHPLMNEDDIVTVVKQLIRGCNSESKGWCVPNQVGYYRALQGISKAINFDRLSMKSLDKECRACLKEHNMRIHLGLSEEAFAKKLGQRARSILDSYTIPIENDNMNVD